MNNNLTINAFKHSGTSGDLIYSLPLVKHLGGGMFYLHLNQVDWIGKHYYGVEPSEFHKGRMGPKDFNFMKTFMEAQSYITQFNPLDPKSTEITHNLDMFRVPFVGHPGNYVDIYATIFGIVDPSIKQQLRDTQWLTVPEPKFYPGRTVLVNRTGRWLPNMISPKWKEWQGMGIDENAFFVGLPEEYKAFQQATGWFKVPFQPTETLLDMAQYIAGSESFIGNQSVALAVAIGLGHPHIYCEVRRDLPKERNECYFPDNPRISYF